MIIGKIAFRNLREHKVKTIIIGSLVAIGIILLIVGNSFMDTIGQGIRESYSENYTGDIILRTFSEESVSFAGGSFVGEPVPILENYASLEDYVNSLDMVEQSSPVLTGYALLFQGESSADFTMLWGIDPEQYFAMFPDSIALDEGEFLKNGEEGIMISQSIAENMAAELGYEVKVGDLIKLQGMNANTGTKIRELEIKGFFHFANSSGQDQVDSVSLVDMNTMRILAGLTKIKSESYEPVETSDFIGDDLFGGDLFGDSLISDASTSGSVLQTDQDFNSILGDTSRRDVFTEIDPTTWHFMTLRARDASAIPALLQQITMDLAETHPEVVVSDWQWGAGGAAEFVYGIQSIFLIIVIVISFASVIIIMNTLIISVTERMNEIGTIRAIGGQKNFVRKMIVSETMMITIFFGVIGMAIGSLAIGIINQVGITTDNDFLNLLFGGAVFRPILSVGSLIGSVLMVALMGSISSLYPVSTALKIPPVQAMQR